MKSDAARKRPAGFTTLTRNFPAARKRQECREVRGKLPLRDQHFVVGFPIKSRSHGALARPTRPW